MNILIKLLINGYEYLKEEAQVIWCLCGSTKNQIMSESSHYLLERFSTLTGHGNAISKV